MLKERYARKIIHNGCSVHSEYLGRPRDIEPNIYPRDGFFNPHLTSIKDSYNLYITNVVKTSKNVHVYSNTW